MRQLPLILGLTAALALALTLPAQAEEGRVLRLVGETPSAPGALPQRFVIDAVLEAGSGPLSVDVDEGWFAPLGAEPPPGDELEGSCVDGRCAFSADYGDDKLVITGDLLKAGPVEAKLVLMDREEKAIAQGAARLTPFADTVPGLGRLAAPAAITGAELSELLMWQGFPGGFFGFDDDPPDDFQRGPLSEWQAANDRPPTGLVLVDDLAALKAAAQAAQAEVGWTEVSNPQGGWKAGYPAKLMQSLSAASSPTERRFASADGKVTLVIGADPPMSDDAWDAFVDKEGDDGPDRSASYTRVNDDFEITITGKGMVTAAVYRNGDRALRRMVLTYPEADAERWGQIAIISQFVFRRGASD